MCQSPWPTSEATACPPHPTSPPPFPPSEEWKDLLGEILPCEGAWSDEQYLVLTEHTNRLVEFTDGYLEALPMPTDRHQAILEFLFLAFLQVIKPSGGKVRFAPLPPRIRPGKFRKPDLLLLLSAADPRRQKPLLDGRRPSPGNRQSRQAGGATWCKNAPTMRKPRSRNTGL